MDKTIVVIGLGEFGWHLALSLSEAGGAVIAIDEKQQRINAIKEQVSKAIAADAKQRQTLLVIVPKEADSVVVALGSIESSIIVTLFLKEMGIKNLYVKANSDEHERILKLLGIDSENIIFPEKNMATRVSERLLNKNLLDYLPFSEDYSIAEVAPLDEMLGKSLVELNFRRRYGLSIIAIRELIPPKMVMSPPLDFKIKTSDILIVLGLKEGIDKYHQGK
ncbi:MAG: TrkA family potassium uptake protein [bacterium]